MMHTSLGVGPVDHLVRVRVRVAVRVRVRVRVAVRVRVRVEVRVNVIAPCRAAPRVSVGSTAPPPPAVGGGRGVVGRGVGGVRRGEVRRVRGVCGGNVQGGSGCMVRWG